MISTVLILPLAQRGNGDKGSFAMGHANAGVSTYAVPLSATGAEPATHYGCHTWASDQFLATVQAARGGTLPAGVDWSKGGVTAAAVRQMAAALTISTRPDGEHKGHFDAAVEAAGLKRIRPPRPGAAGAR